MARSFIVYQGEDETPEFDLTEPESPVHVIWEEIEAGGRAFNGESTTNSIPVRDEQGGTGNELSLPSGIDFISLSRGSRWVWMDGPDGEEVIMASGRIGTKDYSRGRQKADRAREVVIQAADRNEELTEIIIDDWVRPEETDVARVLALAAAYLNGSPRTTTVLATTYVASDNTVTMPAKTYDGTNPRDILNEIALAANKRFFVTVDDELWYDVATSTTYRAGLRISDRLDEVDYASCGASGGAVTIADTGDSSPPGGADGTGKYEFGSITADSSQAILVSISSNSRDVDYVRWYPDPSTPVDIEGDTYQTFTKVGDPGSGVPHIEVWLLQAPTTGSAGTILIQHSTVSDKEIYSYLLLDNAATADYTVVTNTGTGTSVSTATTATAGDFIIDTMGWWENLGTPTVSAASGSQTVEAGNLWFGNPGVNDGELIVSSLTAAGSDSMGWTTGASVDWEHIVISFGSSVSVGTWPPTWDVGPSSTEDGLELVSGLRLYYGQDGAYVYVNHPDTAAAYWHAERSFYTQDPAIDDSTKATELAEAMLTRLRFEERTYNVSIGPLNEDQVGCIKPGQLIDIKARAIPDADDQFRSRRIAQLKWTTPRPGVFFARMQLDRPIKDLPFGIGAKEGHDALEQHKEGDSHPASAIVVTPFETIAATDVQAALEEIFDEAGGGVHDHDADYADILHTHGSPAAGFHGVLVQRTTNFTTANSNDSNPDFDTEVYDTDGLWDAGAPERITIPASWDGLMAVFHVHCAWGTGTDGYAELKLYRNVAAGAIGSGNDDKLIGVAQYPPATSYNTFTELITPPIQVAEGDFFVLAVRNPAAETAITYEDIAITMGAYLVEPGEGAAGEGVPAGGTAGQVLTKDSGTDYDTSWQDPTGGSVWHPVMVQDPSDSKWYVVVDEDGTAVMAEAP